MRRRGGRGLVTCAALVAGITSMGTARANLRAPMMVPQAQSSALSARGDTGLVAVGETLSFTCEAAGSPRVCAVVAKYRVRAAAAGRWRFEFVLPAARPVSASVGPQDRAGRQEVAVAPTVPVEPDEAEQERERAGGRHRHEPPPRGVTLYQAAFEASLAAGDNTITVEYAQPMGAIERDYGYFKKHGRFVDTFRYEVWPVGEWQRDPGFRVALQVSLLRSPPGWWKRTFGKVTSVGCRAWGAASSGIDAMGVRREQRGGRLIYEATLGPELPDELECEIGDDDLVPGEEKRR